MKTLRTHRLHLAITGLTPVREQILFLTWLLAAARSDRERSIIARSLARLERKAARLERIIARQSKSLGVIPESF